MIRTLRSPEPSIRDDAGTPLGRLRVVISGHETCGLIHDLEAELESRGHDVVTIAMRDRFVPHDYDYQQYDFPVSFLSRAVGLRGVWEFLLARLWEVKPTWHKALDYKLRLGLARRADLYLRVWGDAPFDRELLGAVDGARVATFFMGSDVRDYDVFRQEFGITRWKIPAEYYSVPLADKVRILRTHERYADAIFSVPDQMGLALRPYHHLQIPVRMDQFTYRVPARTVPKVVHAPSAPFVKGTDLIQAALEELRVDGVEFEFVSLRELPHRDLLRILTDADVLVDQLVVHGPGWLGFEAMASGCAVATRYFESSPPCFRPPVWSIDEHNLAQRLRMLLTDRDLRVRLAVEGRQYVEANNRVDRVVDSIIEKTFAGPDARADYFPDYLTTRYIPKSDDEARAINDSNVLVSQEPWYRACAAGRVHDGLIF